MNASDPVLKIEADATAQLDDLALCDKVWQIVTDAYYDQNPTWADEEPEFNRPESVFATRLSPHWWAAYGLHALEYDVLAGGLQTFFFNQAGDMNEGLPAAFELVGANEYIPPFKEAVAVFDSFGDTLYNEDWEHTDEEYEQEDNRFDQALTDADSKLSELMNAKDPRTYLAAYIRENIAKYQNGANNEGCSQVEGRDLGLHP